MGTRVRIVLYAPGPEEATDAVRAAFAEVAAVDAAMSDYRPDSELSILSRSAGEEGRKVSEPLFEVLSAAQRVARDSDGAFDVTVGPLVALWRRARREKKLPDPFELWVARSTVGYKLLQLDPATRTARLGERGMFLDLGGIAKGYACDRAVAALTRRGVTRAMVDAGGGMALGDPPPDAPAWRIQVGGTSKLLLLSRCGVATSGDWEQYVEVGGKRYSHIVDPKTGLGLVDSATVTVVARDGMEADAWSTALSVLGPDRGLRAAERHPGGLQAYFVWREEEKRRTAHTAGFGALVEPER